MKIANLIILLALLSISFISLKRDNKRYEKFKSLTDSKDRQKFFKRWTIEPFLLYGLLSLVILFSIGQLHTLKSMPDFLLTIFDSVQLKSELKENNFISGILKGIAISIVPFLLFGSVIGTYLRERKELKGGLKSNENNFRNLDALVPRNFKERIWGAILSINAGFSEEIFFRLLVPILIYSITDSTLLAIFGSTIWFGLGHYYQGTSGMIVTFFVGLLLFAVYLITQNIWMTMIVHAILDINGLVLGPWLRERFKQQTSN